MNPQVTARIRTLEPDTHNGLCQTLLDSTLAIPFKIDWASKKYTYVGPQIEDLLGWSVDSWKSVDDWANRIHPDERESTVSRCVELSLAGVDHAAEYRALTKDHGVVWVKEVVHVLCDEQGQTAALIGFTFDITEQKKAEALREALHHELQAQKLSNALLQERLRLTHDLHDGLGGTLVHMIALVEQSQQQLSQALTSEQMLSMLKLLRNDLRQTIDSNSTEQVHVPVSPQEWLALLRRRFNQLFDVLHIDSSWQYPDHWRIAPNALQYLALTRLIEEALTNVIKHSQAQHLRLSVTQPEADVLEIEDDGVGFDIEAVEASGLGVGMRSMSLRVARVGGQLVTQSRSRCTLLVARVMLKASTQGLHKPD